MRAMSWAVRVTFADGRVAFLRRGGVIGHGPIATFYTKACADTEASFLREGLDAKDVVTVIERSHGRQAEALRGDREKRASPKAVCAPSRKD